MEKSLAHSTLAKTVIDRLGDFRIAAIMVIIAQSFWVIAYIYPN